MAAIDIDSEIRKLDGESLKKNKIKACLFNLIVFARDEMRGDFLRGLIKSIVQKMPCRLISIRCLTESHEPLGVEVKQYAGDGLEKEVVCDHIAIRCPVNELEKIPYLILPQFAPDLPIYVIWADDPSSSPFVLEAFKKKATRLIFDLESVFVFKKYPKKILDLLSESKDVIDIPWAMMSSWREIFFKVFDTKDKLLSLNHAAAIEIHFNAIESIISKRTSTFALYLTAWLAGSFSWKLKSISCVKNTTLIEYENGPSFHLVPKIAEELLQGAIISIEVKAKTFQLFQMAYKKNPSRVLVHESTKELCQLPLTFPYMDLTKGLNFIKELFFLKAEAPYLKTMIELEKLSEKEGSICEI